MTKISPRVKDKIASRFQKRLCSCVKGCAADVAPLDERGNVIADPDPADVAMAMADECALGCALDAGEVVMNEELARLGMPARSIREERDVLERAKEGLVNRLLDTFGLQRSPRGDLGTDIPTVSPEVAAMRAREEADELARELHAAKAAEQAALAMVRERDMELVQNAIRRGVPMSAAITTSIGTTTLGAEHNRLFGVTPRAHATQDQDVFVRSIK